MRLIGVGYIPYLDPDRQVTLFEDSRSPVLPGVFCTRLTGVSFPRRRRAAAPLPGRATAWRSNQSRPTPAIEILWPSSVAANGWVTCPAPIAHDAGAVGHTGRAGGIVLMEWSSNGRRDGPLGPRFHARHPWRSYSAGVRLSTVLEHPVTQPCCQKRLWRCPEPRRATGVEPGEILLVDPSSPVRRRSPRPGAGSSPRGWAPRLGHHPVEGHLARELASVLRPDPRDSATTPVDDLHRLVGEVALARRWVGGRVLPGQHPCPIGE